MKHLVFNYENDYTYTVWYNGKRIDSVDINNIEHYTQAHIVIAKLARTLNCDIYDICLEYVNNKLDIFPLSFERNIRYNFRTLYDMADHIKDAYSDIYNLK